MYLKVAGNGEPVRLFVAGIHGDEKITTEPILKELIDINIRYGSLIISSLSGGEPYISTLDGAYYESRPGIELLTLIREYRPGIYLELHSYSLENHSKLTDPERKKQIGVPPFTELDEKILIGSVSPHIRTSEFDIQDFCITLEIPTRHSEKARNIVLDIMKTIALSESREEIISKLKKEYPDQILAVERNFMEFLKDLEKISLF